jgi:hypothetical protein
MKSGWSAGQHRPRAGPQPDSSRLARAGLAPLIIVSSPARSPLGLPLKKLLVLLSFAPLPITTPFQSYPLLHFPLKKIKQLADRASVSHSHSFTFFPLSAICCDPCGNLPFGYKEVATEACEDCRTKIHLARRLFTWLLTPGAFRWAKDFYSSRHSSFS